MLSIIKLASILKFSDTANKSISFTTGGAYGDFTCRAESLLL